MENIHNEALSAYKVGDFAKAYELWQKEAKNNSDQAMANLGIMYLKGEGVSKDFQKAKEWFDKASEFDNDSANYNLALMYQSKIGVEEDFDKAIEYFRKAGAKNHTLANFRLAVLLLKDRNDEEKVKEGFKCMLKAALSGHTMAKMQIGGLDKKRDKSAVKNEKFRQSSYEKQLEVLNDALDRYIRPILIKDGGNIFLIDFINEPDIEIRLAYQGNCAGCSWGATSTFGLIYDTLSKVIDEGIEVFVL